MSGGRSFLGTLMAEDEDMAVPTTPPLVNADGEHTSPTGECAETIDSAVSDEAPGGCGDAVEEPVADDEPAENVEAGDGDEEIADPKDDGRVDVGAPYVEHGTSMIPPAPTSMMKHVGFEYPREAPHEVGCDESHEEPSDSGPDVVYLNDGDEEKIRQFVMKRKATGEWSTPPWKKPNWSQEPCIYP